MAGLKIKKREHNLLLSREAVEAAVHLDKPISNAEAKRELALELKKPEENIVLKGIYKKFGKPETTINAYVYDNQEALKKFEPHPKEAKKKEELKETKPGAKKEGEAAKEKPEAKAESKKE